MKMSRQYQDTLPATTAIAYSQAISGLICILEILNINVVQELPNPS